MSASEPTPPLGRVPPNAMLDLRRLAMLTEVARCGSFSAAAESLCYTPSAVSQQMTGLARDLGVVLFERTPRGMLLTAYAEALVTHVHAVFAQLGDAQAEMDEIAGGSRGRLRVGSFPAATVAFVAKATGAFQRRFPQVEVSFSDGEPYQSVARLKERVLDLAVVFDFDHWTLATDYDGRAVCQDREIECVELFDDPFVAVLPRDHALAGRECIDIGDLEGERILGGPSDCSPWGTDLRHLCQRAGFDPIFEPRYRTADSRALQAFVATGRGITLMPQLAASPAHPGCVLLALTGGPVRHVRVAMLVGIPLWPACREMITMLRQGVADLPSASCDRASMPDDALVAVVRG